MVPGASLRVEAMRPSAHVLVSLFYPAHDPEIWAERNREMKRRHKEGDWSERFSLSFWPCSTAEVLLELAGTKKEPLLVPTDVSEEERALLTCWRTMRANDTIGWDADTVFILPECPVENLDEVDTLMSCDLGEVCAYFFEGHLQLVRVRQGLACRLAPDWTPGGPAWAMWDRFLVWAPAVHFHESGPSNLLERSSRDRSSELRASHIPEGQSRWYPLGPSRY